MHIYTLYACRRGTDSQREAILISTGFPFWTILGLWQMTLSGCRQSSLCSSLCSGAIMTNVGNSLASVHLRIPCKAICQRRMHSKTTLLRSACRRPTHRASTPARPPRRHSHGRIRDLGPETARDYAAIRDSYGASVPLTSPDARRADDSSLWAQPRPSTPSSSPTASLASPSSPSPPSSLPFSTGTA